MTTLVQSISRFIKPVWTAPLDSEAQIAAIPDSGTIAGMFPGAIVYGAKQRYIELPSAQSRYVAFSFYPQREHARLLCEAAAAFYPAEPLRQALRILGHEGPRALLRSPLGKVVLGTAEGVHQAVAAMARAYVINLKPSRVDVLETAAGQAIVKLTGVHYFLDCHHVGMFEGLLQYAGVMGEVLVDVQGPGEAEMLLRW